MSVAAGTWNLEIATPFGKQDVVLHLTETDGVLTGTSTGILEEVPMVDPKLEGDKLTWKESITKPMRLHLEFDVAIDGDSLSGVSKAGHLFPKSRITGTRSTT